MKGKKTMSKLTLKQALERITELEDELTNERERADILSDKLDQYEDDEHPDSKLVDRDEFSKLEESETVVDNLHYLQEELSIAKWRANLGIEYAKTEVENILEQLQELEV